MFTAGHPEDDVLENYAMGRLPEPSVESLEEHVLICEACQDRLHSTESYVRGMKRALASAEKARPSRGVLLQMPTPVWIAAAAVLVIGIAGLITTRYGPSAPPVAITLSATRGETASVPATGPLELKLDARDLGTASSYRVQIVNAEGADVWNQPAAAMEDGYVRVPVKKHLGRGQYFVRLFPSDAGTPREYSLQLR